MPTISENNTLEMYLKLYPIEERGGKLIFYKSVRKVWKKYVSNYDAMFEYKIGKKKEEKVQKDENNSCWGGIHISDKSRAISFGYDRENQALLECEVDPKNVFISKDCDGKVRTSELKVLREVPKEERYI